MKRGIEVALLSAVLAFSSSAAVFAVDTSTPTPTPTSTSTSTPSPQQSVKAKPAKQGLTQAQKDGIAAARLAFSNAKTNAKNGFGRAVADAQAIRDQAISAAGANKAAVMAARKDYRNSYNAILLAYRMDISNAKIAFQTAIAALKLPHPISS